MKRKRKIPGISNHPLYPTWSMMIGRCKNPSNASYDRYGGRGIFVCERWKSFHNFVEDMGPKPNVKMTLERVDNDGPYSPDNCRWATMAEQNANKSSNISVDLEGEKVPLAEAERRLGLGVDVIRNRLRKGWPIERAVSTPQRGWVHRK